MDPCTIPNPKLNSKNIKKLTQETYSTVLEENIKGKLYDIGPDIWAMTSKHK